MGEYGWAFGVAIIILAVSAGRVIRTLSQTLGNRQRGGEGDSAAAAELRGQVEEMQQRLAELEERVDFTERLLAKQREGARLAPPD
jgi:hypothetical protein